MTRATAFVLIAAAVTYVGAVHAAESTQTPQENKAAVVADESDVAGDGVKSAVSLQPSNEYQQLNQLQVLPTGVDKSGVSSQAISVPQGAGKMQGMGESFSAQLSTGIATYSVPIERSLEADARSIRLQRRTGACAHLHDCK